VDAYRQDDPGDPPTATSATHHSLPRSFTCEAARLRGSHTLSLSSGDRCGPMQCESASKVDIRVQSPARCSSELRQRGRIQYRVRSWTRGSEGGPYIYADCRRTRPWSRQDAGLSHGGASQCMAVRDSSTLLYPRCTVHFDAQPAPTRVPAGKGDHVPPTVFDELGS